MFEREEIRLGTNTNCTTYHDCFACRRQLIVHMDWSEGFNYDSANEEAEKRGWHRRRFYKSADPWFCSYDCSHNSPQAKYCEEYWAKEIKRKDEENSFLGKLAKWLG